MKNFLKPSKKKLLIFFALVAGIGIILVLLIAINERDIASIIVVPLVTIPVKIFDFITRGAFVPSNCYVICFLTIPQLSFILFFDIIVVYLVSCVIASLRSKITE